MIELELSYKQFCIFNETVSNPFNDWSEANVAQGFSISEGSIDEEITKRSDFELTSNPSEMPLSKNIFRL